MIVARVAREEATEKDERFFPWRRSKSHRQRDGGLSRAVYIYIFLAPPSLPRVKITMPRGERVLFFLFFFFLFFFRRIPTMYRFKNVLLRERVASSCVTFQWSSHARVCAWRRVRANTQTPLAAGIFYTGHRNSPGEKKNERNDVLSVRETARRTNRKRKGRNEEERPRRTNRRDKLAEPRGGRRRLGAVAEKGD